MIVLPNETTSVATSLQSFRVTLPCLHKIVAIQDIKAAGKLQVCLTQVVGPFRLVHDVIAGCELYHAMRAVQRRNMVKHYQTRHPNAQERPLQQHHVGLHTENTALRRKYHFVTISPAPQLFDELYVSTYDKGLFTEVVLSSGYFPIA